jgi:hypothetical protein
MQRTPVFTSDWPSYAFAAHVICWSASMLFLLSCIAGYFGLIGGQAVFVLLWLTLASGFALGLTAVFSGRLYWGNQVFSKTPSPLIGWTARLAGMIVTGLFAFIMFFTYGIFSIGH